MAFNINTIIQQVIAAQQKANAANEARFQTLLSTNTQGEQAALGQIDIAQQAASGFGQTALQDVQRQGQVREERSTQGLISRGLFNTTSGVNIGRAIDADVSRERGRIREGQGQQAAQFAQQRAGIISDFSGRQAGAIERRTDRGPDLNQFAGLLQAASPSLAPQSTTTRRQPRSVASIFNTASGRR